MQNETLAAARPVGELRRRGVGMEEDSYSMFVKTRGQSRHMDISYQIPLETSRSHELHHYIMHLSLPHLIDVVYLLLLIFLILYTDN